MFPMFLRVADWNASGDAFGPARGYAGLEGLKDGFKWVLVESHASNPAATIERQISNGPYALGGGWQGLPAESLLRLDVSLVSDKAAGICKSPPSSSPMNLSLVTELGVPLDKKTVTVVTGEGSIYTLVCYTVSGHPTSNTLVAKPPEKQSHLRGSSAEPSGGQSTEMASKPSSYTHRLPSRNPSLAQVNIDLSLYIHYSSLLRFEDFGRCVFTKLGDQSGATHIAANLAATKQDASTLARCNPQAESIPVKTSRFPTPQLLQPQGQRQNRSEDIVARSTADSCDQNAHAATPADAQSGTQTAGGYPPPPPLYSIPRQADVRYAKHTIKGSASADCGTAPAVLAHSTTAPVHSTAPAAEASSSHLHQPARRRVPPRTGSVASRPATPSTTEPFPSRQMAPPRSAASSRFHPYDAQARSKRSRWDPAAWKALASLPGNWPDFPPIGAYVRRASIRVDPSSAWQWPVPVQLDVAVGPKTPVLPVRL
ncbi:hypothetical protein HK105_205817 [Polyrhizophydium stewartii]|uniref:Uncharacterized protein n=1 Tax=Polyrhizophydium stewartii TaxID=2732419 RepID=A0ABR4N561_9FUNG